MSEIRISALKKNYDDVEVIHGIDVDIKDGEFAVLVGPSGCGKSTLLRMIAGLEDVSSGVISIGDTVVNDLAPRERNIAMVFQNYALYPHMTVAENMGYALKIKRIPKPEIAIAVKEAAEILGLENLLGRRPGQLSGGQRQRVAMGRAIVRAPEVFLFDEPLSNLDAKLRVKMRGEIKTLHQRLGTTIVYVTHDQIEAMTMADKIIVLDGGHISQMGTPLELYDHPANKFVATFIGSPSMNILPATVIDNSSLRLADGQVLALSNTLSAGTELELGIRPEHMHLAADGLNAKVTLIEPTGAETMISASLAGQPVLLTVSDRVLIGPGDMTSITIEPENTHLFDPQTGHKLS
ncbi:sn-glycerol-3-phosphate ABC transporter ATP-binding protein UgpC [Cognatishimia sp. WU-CL00825]|uniref:ABC transporter ATP-binding protein n=1 Tax=Cognatishimia sp. WU-CL00825 TaxID=3127658 RepID=UPI003105B081